MILGNKKFDTDNNTYIWGILNVTPDSFSDGSKFNNPDAALRQTEKMIREGASIIDVGGESTRPGYTMISDEEEIERVCPVIEKIKSNFDTVVSVDTYKSKVAEAAISSGADILNDVHGLKYDDKIAGIAAKYGVGVCIMHNRDNMDYGDNSLKAYMREVLTDMQLSMDIARKAGIDRGKIIVDPGVGFAKNLDMNLWITNNVDALKIFECPILLAASRKSMIGLTLDLPVDEREEGTIVTTVIGVLRGVSFVRVHDVEKNYRAIRMAKAILESGRYCPV